MCSVRGEAERGEVERIEAAARGEAERYEDSTMPLVSLLNVRKWYQWRRIAI